VPTPDQSALQPSEPTAQGAQTSPQELDQLVAPISLYPDALVAQILAAATYPAEVVEAERWLHEHPGLKAAALAQAVDLQSWDASVKALMQFPSVLAMMTKNLSWTSSLGDAYVNEPQSVLNAVQVMRQRAQQAGNLKSTQQQTVTNQGQSIVIEPADPDIVYVPEYDPWEVYGAPLALYPGWVAVPGVFIDGPGIAFGLGIGIGVFAGFGWGWHHWGTDWHQHDVIYDHDRYISHSSTFMHRDQFGRGYGLPAHSGEPPRLRGRSQTSRTVQSPGLAHGGFSGGRSSGLHSGAFSGFNHGGVVSTFSSRGRASFGGSFHGGGFHGGGAHR
jgi:hypothetical protein